MTVESNKEIVSGVFAAMARADLAQVLNAMDASVEWIAPETSPMGELLATSHRVAGKEAIGSFLISGVSRVFPIGLRVEVRNLLGDGGAVVAEVTISGPLANGKLYENSYCFVIELESGKITRIREYLDTRKFADLAGLQTPAGAGPRS